MKRFALCSVTILSAVMFWATNAVAQLPSADRSDENANDTLSRQILKLEQQISATRPGVIIGETPSPGAAETKAPQTGNSHVVAKGETLTSIAKMHKVSVEELQKLNHIENDRKLQIGQTIMIPVSSSAQSPTPAPSPNG